MLVFLKFNNAQVIGQQNAGCSKQSMQGQSEQFDNNSNYQSYDHRNSEREDSEMGNVEENDC